MRDLWHSKKPLCRRARPATGLIWLLSLGLVFMGTACQASPTADAQQAVASDLLYTTEYYCAVDSGVFQLGLYAPGLFYTDYQGSSNVQIPGTGAEGLKMGLNNEGLGIYRNHIYYFDPDPFGTSRLFEMDMRAENRRLVAEFTAVQDETLDVGTGVWYMNGWCYTCLRRTKMNPDPVLNTYRIECLRIHLDSGAVDTVCTFDFKTGQVGFIVGVDDDWLYIYKRTGNPASGGDAVEQQTTLYRCAHLGGEPEILDRADEKRIYMTPFDGRIDGHLYYSVEQPGDIGRIYDHDLKSGEHRLLIEDAGHPTPYSIIDDKLYCPVSGAGPLDWITVDLKSGEIERVPQQDLAPRNVVHGQVICLSDSYGLCYLSKADFDAGRYDRVMYIDNPAGVTLAPGETPPSWP